MDVKVDTPPPLSFTCPQDTIVQRGLLCCSSQGTLVLEPSNVLGEHATTGFHLIFVALLHDVEEGREQGEALGSGLVKNPPPFGSCLWASVSPSFTWSLLRRR